MDNQLDYANVDNNDHHVYQLVKLKVDQLSLEDKIKLSNELSTLERESPRLAVIEKRYNDLTKREVEVLQLVAQGYTRKQIGTQLAISHNTVACHIAHIYEKLDITSIAEATSVALELDLEFNQSD